MKRVADLAGRELRWVKSKGCWMTNLLDGRNPSNRGRTVRSTMARDARLVSDHSDAQRRRGERVGGERRHIMTAAPTR